MAWIQNLLIVVQVLSALGIIVLVLLQQGKSADMGAAFGSGSSGTVFGASGSANFLSRSTAVMAAIFFSSTLGLNLLATPSARTSGGSGGIMETIPGAIPGASPPAPAQPAGEAGSSPVNQIPSKP